MQIRNIENPLDSPVTPAVPADIPGTIEYWRKHHTPDEIFDPLFEQYCTVGRLEAKATDVYVVPNDQA